MKTKSKILIIIFIVLCGLAVFYCVSNVDNGFVDYTKETKEYNSKLTELKLEREKLTYELKNLEENYKIPDMSSVVFLITDINIKNKTETLSKLTDYNYHGVVALSASNMPSYSNNDCLSKSDIEELENHGYELVIRLEVDEDPIKVYKLFKKEGYKIKGFYLPDSLIYQQTIDDIKSIDGMIIIGDFGKYEDEDILLIQKYGNRNPNVKEYFIESVDESKMIAISVGYDTGRDEEYDSENFSSMLSVISSYTRDGKTKVCNISEVIRRKREYEKKLSIEKADDMKKMNEIKDRIDEIDNEMIKNDIN